MISWVFIKNICHVKVYYPGEYYHGQLKPGKNACHGNTIAYSNKSVPRNNNHDLMLTLLLLTAIGIMKASSPTSHLKTTTTSKSRCTPLCKGRIACKRTRRVETEGDDSEETARSTECDSARLQPNDSSYLIMMATGDLQVAKRGDRPLNECEHVYSLFVVV